MVPREEPKLVKAHVVEGMPLMLQEKIGENAPLGPGAPEVLEPTATQGLATKSTMY